MINFQMHTIKLKRASVILLIFLFYFYGIWLPQVKAEKVSITKDSEQVPANNKKETLETQSAPIEQCEIQSPALDEKPFQAIVVEKTPPSGTVTAEGETLKENTSIREDGQEIATEEEIYDVTSPIILSNPSPDGEVSSIEEEKGDQTSVVDNEQQENTPDEGKASSHEEEKSPISHQVNTDEGEFQDIKEMGVSSYLPEPSPATAREEGPFPEFDVANNESSEETSPTNEDKEDIVIDKDMLSDVKEEETLSIAPTSTPSTPSPGEEMVLVKEEKGTQSSIVPDEESISLLQEEKLPIEYQSVRNEEISLQKPVGDIAESEGSGHVWEIWHKDPTHAVILAIAIILIAAKIAEWLARRLRLPGVVGKLIIGMILGNVITFTGWDFFDFLRTMPFVKMISYFGTLILLFTAGLNTDLRALLRVGTSSLLVCLGGIIAPAGLGLMVGHFLLPDISSGTKLLLAIVLCNSSTGLLLAVLSELKAINTLEGRVIAGATILTDIIVILTFGVVSGFVVKGGGSLVGMSLSFGIAITSLIISLIVIVKYGDKFGNFLTKRLTEGLNIPIVVILSLLLAFMFGSVGLHTVIGAFVAGLFLRNVKLWNSDDGEHRNVESFIRPFYMLLVPILFVRVGAQVELGSFFNLNALLLGLAITGAAVIGKMFCSVCPIEKGINRLAIGIGMATKMEGTLILAGLGRDMGTLSDTVFSSVIMAIVFTSIICPSLLRNILLKKGCSPEILPVTKEKKELEGAVLN
ncbi:MAG: cation:proton antiporter [Planctomycetia bacterium]|uniref:cation:proton antiporter n=1 Tax=Candidatus Kuenenia sp. TaxID=2499824 RepID=UPI001DC0F463|nr:cation:proton antiporter [Planctomycetia bacterium]